MILAGTSILGWQRGGDGETTFSALNAATGETLDPPFQIATETEITQAAQLAEEAFAVYRKWSGAQRGKMLRAIAARLEINTEAIVVRASSETALPPARLQGEMARTCGQLRLFAVVAEEGSWVDARIDHADRDRKPVPRPDVRSLLAPLGPVAVFSASNFPLAFSVAGGDTASALAAGCPVIVKAHEGHPGTSELVGLLVQEAARECGAPEGVFSLLQGPGKTVGVSLVRQPAVQAVGFTGSRGAGLALMAVAAARPQPIPVYAEMGSVNPVFLLPGALAERAETIAAGLHGSVTLGVGQFCTNPGLVFYQNDEAGSLLRQKLTGLMQETAQGTMLAEGIRRAYMGGIARSEGIPGVRQLTQSVDVPERRAAAALLAVNAADFLRQPELLAEVFGPATLLVECASSEEMLAAARSLDGQLTATVYGTDADFRQAGALFDALTAKAGRLVCNGFPTGVEVCPAMHHGGPYPATGDGRATSVGTRAIERFARPVCYQDFPAAALPEELRDENPRRLQRLVDGRRDLAS